MKCSTNGRYFTNDSGAPEFWLGDTQWQLFRSFSIEDAVATLENRKRHGFTAIQVMVLGVDIEPNVNGDLPFEHNDPLTPNERYFHHVDRILERAAEIGDVTIVLGVYHMRYTEGCFTRENARGWAHWLGRRYRDTPGLVWSMYPAARPEYLSITREIASGLAEGDGGNHLITVHPDPSPASSSTLFHDEEWLSFNTIQTFKEVEKIVPMTQADYLRTPIKPVVMAEGAYEAGTEYGFEVTPLWVRRQAYYTCFAGGHHSYGHNDSWRLLPTWREALDAPGAVQMGVLKRIFLSLPEWWELVPDMSLLADGKRTDGQILTLAAAHSRGEWAAVYAADASSFSVNIDALDGGTYHARWIDPRDGATVETSVVSGGIRTFTSPEGMEDGVLTLIRSGT
ncbi:MAG: DUF4038 domain-containing protein [Spirochaetales bacterium]|nr:MAG: DUF4038 domain-containing protein [Spirochaetales bacterium]